jgi:MFS family permease
VGPFLGGWLIDSVSWRLAFFVNLPFAAVVVLASRHVPETRSHDEAHLDLRGALTASLGLASVTYGLIESAPIVLVLGLVLLGGFLAVELRSDHPMLPLGIFRNRQFSGANATTLAVYAALSGAFFLLAVELQSTLGYSALEAGSALLPVTLIMLALSARAGALAQRIGPRLPMAIGPLGVAAGLLLWTRVDAGSTYVGAVLPGAVVFGLGLSLTVAPLTATIMAAADEEHLGVASGVNNAVARVAGLLAVALLPTVVGLDTAGSAGALDSGVDKAMAVAAGLAVVGGAIAFATVRTVTKVTAATQPALHPCGEPCQCERAAA